MAMSEKTENHHIKMDKEKMGPSGQKKKGNNGYPAIRIQSRGELVSLMPN